MKRHHLSTSIYITGVYQGERKKMRRKFEKQLSNIMEWEKSETYIMKEEISQRSSVSRNVTEKKKSIKNMGKYSSCRISNIFIVISKINEENSIYLVSLYYSFSTKCRAISMQEPGISSDSKFFSLFLIMRKVSVASDCRQLYECNKVMKTFGSISNGG